MDYTTLITGGHIIDPALGVNEKGDVLISDGKIAGNDVKAKKYAHQIIQADGCIVVPGLIDFHAHVFFEGTDSSIPPDVGMLPNGVTTTVDGGTAGTANYELFHKNVIANSLVRIKSFLSVSPTGQATNKYDENQNPKYYDEEKMERLFRKYPDELLGLKVRQSQDVVGELGLSPLQKALEIAERLSCKVAVHTTDSPGTTGEIVNLFRKGDIFAHVFHGKGSTIIGQDGKVIPEVTEARKRGVLFDAANGKNHFAFKTAKAALADGFMPDIISSDLTWMTMFKQPTFGLPWIMSKYLALGMKLSDIVNACTATPAAAMGMAGEIGTLAPGACADVTILKLIDYPCDFVDVAGDHHLGTTLLLPQATIREGRIVFRQLNF
jgi:predicted amidohydrolase